MNWKGSWTPISREEAEEIYEYYGSYNAFIKYIKADMEAEIQYELEANGMI